MATERWVVYRGCELHAFCAVADVVRHFARFRGRALSFVELALRWRARRPRYSRPGDKACLKSRLGRPCVCNPTLAVGSHLRFQLLLPFVKRQLVRDNPHGDLFVPSMPPADSGNNACVDRWLHNTRRYRQRHGH